MIGMAYAKYARMTKHDSSALNAVVEARYRTEITAPMAQDMTTAGNGHARLLLTFEKYFGNMNPLWTALVLTISNEWRIYPSRENAQMIRLPT
jgi:hypothetical protein